MSKGGQKEKTFKWPSELECKGLDGSPQKYGLPTRVIADLIYKAQGVGVEGGVFAHKLYTADENTDFSKEEFEFVIRWGQNVLPPMVCDGLKEYVASTGSVTGRVYQTQEMK